MVQLLSKSGNKDPFLLVYAYSVCAYIFALADTSWTKFLPITLYCSLITIVSIVKIGKDKVRLDQKKLLLCFIYCFFCITTIIIWRPEDNFIMLRMLASFLTMTSIILLSHGDKVFLLKLITNCFIFVLVISLFGWLLYLAKVPLPHSGIIYHPNGFHIYSDYYFFLLSAKDIVYFPRFQSIFLEAGQMATPCAFLFFLNGANFSRKNIVLLVSVLLSFSLIAYALVIASFVSNRMLMSSRNRVAKTLLSITFVMGISLYFVQDESSDDPITAMIFNRLEYDEEKGIVGNNRTSREFDIRYNRFINSSDKYWGIYTYLKNGYDWTYNCSGYKKFIVHYGIIGFCYFMFFIIMLLWYNRSLASFILFLLVVTAFFVRNLLQSPMWLSIAILGFYVLHTTTTSKNSSDKVLKLI